MNSWIKERENKLREFFELSSEVELISPEAVESFEISSGIAKHLEFFNFEWHIIPSAEAVPIDNPEYRKKMYPLVKRDSNPKEYKKTSTYWAEMNGHRRHQGRIVAVETTPKPKYLPDNIQMYGTLYGFEPGDPFAPYMRRAGYRTGSRYGHNYKALMRFAKLVSDDWAARSLIPKGYRLTICPPVVFNLIGTVFHPEWSYTESLEVGFYVDENGTAKGFAVGSNAPNDFSFFDLIEIGSNWKHIGFRLALVPEQ